MCSCNELLGDCHYRSELEYRDECARQAAASALDWEVLDALHGEPAEASERAEAFAALLAPHRTAQALWMCSPLAMPATGGALTAINTACNSARAPRCGSPRNE